MLPLNAFLFLAVDFGVKGGSRFFGGMASCAESALDIHVALQVAEQRGHVVSRGWVSSRSVHR